MRNQESQWRVNNVPGWMGKSERGSKLSLAGMTSNWAGQPVVSRIRIQKKGKGDGITNRFRADRAMAASWTYIGNADRDVVIFGSQAGAITKRARSLINLGRDEVRDVFSFANTTRSHGPFNHMQRYVIQNFGREDVVRLRNIGKTFRFNDLRSYGNGVYGFNGVPLDKLRITLAPDVR